MLNSAYAQLQFHFFQLRDRELSIEEFEQWIYATTDLAEILNSEDYFQLISLNFSTKWTRENIEKILEKYIDFGQYESAALERMLIRLIQQDENLARILSDFYWLYCEGYHFLKNLGIEYGLRICVPLPKANSWGELDDQQQFLNDLLPGAIAEAKKVLAWLESGEIVITGEYEYFDYRVL
jgi:hypothetical protein